MKRRSRSCRLGSRGEPAPNAEFTFPRTDVEFTFPRTERDLRSRERVWNLRFHERMWNLRSTNECGIYVPANESADDGAEPGIAHYLTFWRLSPFTARSSVGAHFMAGAPPQAGSCYVYVFFGFSADAGRQAREAGLGVEDLGSLASTWVNASRRDRGNRRTQWRSAHPSLLRREGCRINPLFLEGKYSARWQFAVRRGALPCSMKLFPCSAP